ncbi:extracellular catalytic domain type 2 short-chain-length polyhydroxyalkanoate depolymerase [Alteromonas sp. ASW11-130]|uniref:extracellular catalytic domain type 2 short-chain-length polyhydroxyalkanoate depolymerase n=1 Tax=Alteromonas sp. ASW11-130 TaxID=3015775 RepID=UPI002242182E|nr:PHB depolymerase family esterase [Alteromonas sp. ASW11-130]MCW8091426.1 polyhydroxybutyrate depolymerase [Alteromonas sp. ASW11-130]
MKIAHLSLLSAICLPVYAIADSTSAKLKLDLSDITVSGLSSGGYMATQFHIAHSDKVSGAGIIAAGPYYCGQNDITVALNQCVSKMETPVDLALLNNSATKWAQEGKIPSLENLKGDKVWLLHGTKDSKVTPAATELLHTQYKNWVGVQNVTYVNDKPFAHLFPTKEKGGSCLTSDAPYLGNCDYDAAGAMLQAVVGDLAPPSGELSGEIVEFSQSKLAGESAKTMAETGYTYIPKPCLEGAECKVHISFHGCNQYAEAIGKDYVLNTGINEWADSNNIVVVYPQTKKSIFMPLNPQGCWDWWGYTSADYATADGHQITAVMTIVEKLAAGDNND